MLQLFTRQQRLTRPAEFQHVFDQAARVSTADRRLVVLCCKNDKPYARLGMVVARKHIPKAIERNRIKRHIRERFRHYQQRLTGLDIIVMPRVNLSRLSNPQLDELLDHYWQQSIKQCGPS